MAGTGRPWAAVGQFDVSCLPEIFRAQRRHLALLHHPQWWQVDTAISDATHAVQQAFRACAWSLHSGSGTRQFDPGAWPQAAPGAGPGWPGHGAEDLAIEIARPSSHPPSSGASTLQAGKATSTALAEAGNDATATGS